ncbi:MULTISPECIES: ABC transporter ATP-binding protein [unclassified Streptomyces]|uniref:ABC transporter ATP-binding protein n=1 Tax=unclassified Streptomyces TaxID=2593676 RepID=UPI000F6B4835|nr:MULTISPECIES: ABC transporter ATP-binding protein [unclassified Streptomyces]AZM58654.1 multidrug ABC transporter ATP-binding protein [Streptomyces sp. WAC 01438]RSM88347.1 multidrug ABC transporter ATP-binding protein [Streptomyces sp. WAC 01420]
MRRADLPGRNVLWRAVGGQRRDVVVGAVLGMGHQTGEALVPVVIGLAIDRGVVDGDVTGLLLWLGVLALVYVGLSYSFRYGARAGERASVTAAHHLRTELTARVLAPEGGAEEGRLPGELANIATEDARRVGAVTMALIVGTAAATGLAVGAVVLLRISLLLGLLVLLGTPLLLWLVHLLSKPLERRSGTEQERAAHASGVAADLVAGLRVLKGIGAEPAAVARYRRISQDSLTATLRAARAEAWQSGVVTMLTGAFLAVVALVGGRLAARGDIGLGELVSSVALALFLMGPLSEFSWVNAELAQGRASAARIAGVLGSGPAVRTETPSGPPVPRRVEGRLRLRGLSYGTLRGVDLDVSPGETVGVVAPDPADASALLRCLARGADPDEGSVELDGTDVTALGLAELRAAVLVAEHDADLFEGSVLDNVTAARADGPVDAAITASGTDEVADALPDGVDTAVTARGRSLSGGQRQRVALARALAADAPVLVLHEPATAVDAVTEVRMAAGVRELRGGRTTVLVTNSPALLAVTDRVVLVEHGRVTASGGHAQLVHDHADYRTAVLA